MCLCNLLLVPDAQTIGSDSVCMIAMSPIQHEAKPILGFLLSMLQVC